MLFLLFALTGASMAYRVQLEAVVDRALWTASACSKPLALDVLIERARAVHPRAGPLKSIRLYGDMSATARLYFDEGNRVYVDRCNGRVVGSQAPYTGFFGTLGWLHIFGFVPNHHLFAGVVASVFALAPPASCAAGAGR